MGPHEAAGLVSREHRIPVEVVAALGGGGAGAHEVRWGPGARGVLKAYSTASDRDAARRALRLMERLRGRAHPAPRVVLLAESAEALVVVQEWMRGQVEEVVDRSLVADALALVRRQADAGDPHEAGERWGEFVLRALREGLTPEEGYCLHASLRERGGRARELSERVRAAADGLAAADLDAADVVHGDLHHRNLLVEHRRVTAVVDWDSARTGDATFDLVTLAVCSAVARRETDAVARLWDEARRRRGVAVVHAYAAFMALRQVDHAIRRGGDVGAWLALGEEGLSRALSPLRA